MAQAQSETNDMNLLGVDPLTDMSEVRTPSMPVMFTPAGDAYIRKAFHPPSAVPNYKGMPTEDARIVTSEQWRSASINPAPLGISGGIATLDTTDTLGYIVTSGARINAIGILASGGDTNTMKQNYGDVCYNESYNFNNWSSDANLYRLAAKSMTLYPNTTMFNDTGFITTTQWNPAIITQTPLSLLDSPKFGAPLRRMVEDKLQELFSIDNSWVEVRGKAPTVAVHSLEDLRRPLCKRGRREPSRLQGTLIAPLHSNKFDDWLTANKCEPRHLLTAVGLDPDMLAQIIEFNGVTGGLPNPDDITQWSPRSYQGKFRDGNFSVIKQNSISPAYRLCSNTSNITTPVGPGLFQCLYFYYDSADVPHLLNFIEQLAVGQSGGTALTLLDTQWCDTTFAIVLVTGINYNPTPSGTTAQAYNVMIRKFYTTFEIQPAPRSAWVGSAELAPLPDMAAMQHLQRLFFEMKDGMPAKFNLLGTLAKVAGQGLKYVANATAGSIVKDAAASQRRRNNNPIQNGTQESPLSFDDLPDFPAPPTVRARRPPRQPARRPPRPAPARTNTQVANLQREVSKLSRQLANLSVKPKFFPRKQNRTPPKNRRR